MPKDEDDLNWTHFPQDRDETTLADLTQEQATQLARNALKILERRKTDLTD
jgi:hypothetical protein